MAVEVDRDFANAYFNLALVQSINNDPDAAVRTLGKYRDLASEEDGRMAEELLETVKKSLAIAKTARRGSL